MTGYSVALFLHVVGVLGLFIGLGIEWMGLRQLRRATTVEAVHQWMGAFFSLRWLYPVSALLLLGAGLYMIWRLKQWPPWAVLGLVVMLFMAALGALLTGRRMAQIGRADEQGALLAERLHHPFLLISLRVRALMALGVVYLMTVKPGALASALIILAAAALGALSSLPLRGGATSSPAGPRQVWEGDRR